jgi:hypothetical protein
MGADAAGGFPVTQACRHNASEAAAMKRGRDGKAEILKAAFVAAVGLKQDRATPGGRSR